MKKERVYKINLNSAGSRMLNIPLVNSAPTYVRVDGARENVRNELLQADEQWNITAMQRGCNSPNNARAVFITNWGMYRLNYLKVGKSMLTGMVLGIGDGSDKHVRSAKASVALSGCYSIHDFKMMHDKMGFTVEIQRTGLRCIESPWVLSNIEEIYVGNIVLCSDRSNEPGSSYIGNEEDINKSKRNMEISPYMLRNLLFNALGEKNENDICKKFTRLKRIVFVPGNYNPAIGSELFDKANEVKGLEVFDIVKRQIEYAQSKQTSKIGQPVVYELDNQYLSDDIYTTRSGIYVYDRDRLESYFASVKAKKKADRLGVQVENSQTQSESKAIADAEKQLSEGGKYLLGTIKGLVDEMGADRAKVVYAKLIKHGYDRESITAKDVPVIVEIIKYIERVSSR